MKIKEQQKLVKLEREKLEIEKKNLSLDQIRDIEDNLLVEASDIVSTSFKFADISFDDKGEVDSYPEEWDSLPRREREKRVRIAKAMWMPSSDVPYGLKAAHSAVMAIAKARKEETTNKNVLNIQTATFVSPTPTRKLEIIEVDD